MKSNKAKVLHPVFYKPMAAHVITSAQSLEPLQTIVVVGHQAEQVKKAFAPFGCDFALQQEQRGTADAVLATKKSISAIAKTLIILCGDTPLILPETLENFSRFHRNSGNDLTLMTTTLANPFGYGRILCDSDDSLLAIVEEKDATDEQKKITEINAGIYCVEKEFLFSALEKVGRDNSQNEMYLTDIISIGVHEKKRIQRVTIKNPIEVLGINSRQELSEAERELQMRHNRKLMASGVSMIAPETIRVAAEVSIAPDVFLEANVSLLGTSNIASGCHIEQGTILKDCNLDRDVIIGAGSYLANISLPEATIIPPHTCQS